MISFQEYDPDLPPELAAATGIHDVPVENANSHKSDIRQDVMKGSGTGRVRPPLVCICFVKKLLTRYLCLLQFLSSIYLVFVCLSGFFLLVDVAYHVCGG